MQIRWPLAASAFLVSLVCGQPTPEKYKTRLATVAMDASMRSTVAGAGSAFATLADKTLTISGTFEGLRSPATAAKVHRGRITGVRGPAIFDLTVSPAANGTIAGAVELTTDQLDDLRRGRLYIQIDSEKAPDGNLWGWLLK
jgi:CHRD domain